MVLKIISPGHKPPLCCSPARTSRPHNHTGMSFSGAAIAPRAHYSSTTNPRFGKCTLRGCNPHLRCLLRVQRFPPPRLCAPSRSASVRDRPLTLYKASQPVVIYLAKQEGKGHARQPESATHIPDEKTYSLTPLPCPARRRSPGLPGVRLTR